MDPDSGSIERFLEMLIAERGASGNTIDAYKRDLRDFAGSLAKRKQSLGNASSDDIRAYLEQPPGGFPRSGNSIASSMARGTGATIHRPPSTVRARDGRCRRS